MHIARRRLVCQFSDLFICLFPHYCWHTMQCSFARQPAPCSTLQSILHAFHHFGLSLSFQPASSTTLKVSMAICANLVQFCLTVLRSQIKHNISLVWDWAWSQTLFFVHTLQLFNVYGNMRQFDAILFYSVLISSLVWPEIALQARLIFRSYIAIVYAPIWNSFVSYCLDFIK